MAHNFIEGIDWIADPTGNTALANHVFVSKSGSDLTPDGTDPNTPYLTAVAAYNANTSSFIVMGTGIYEEEFAGITFARLISDGVVVLDGTNTVSKELFEFVSNNARIKNFYLKGYDEVLKNNASTNNAFRNVIVEENVILNTEIFMKIVQTSPNVPAFSRNRVIGSTINIGYSVSLPTPQGTNNSLLEEENLYFNSTVRYGVYPHISGAHSTLRESGGNLYVGSVVEVDTTLIGSNRVFNKSIFFNTSFVIDTINYANYAAALLAHPELFEGCLDADPLFLGDPLKYEFIVSSNSPCIAFGVLGRNAGGLKPGNLQNESSTEFGTSPASNVNTQYNAGLLEVVAGNDGRRESATIDLGQVFSGVTVRLNALLDFLNNTPDANNALVNPNPVVFEAQWALNDGVFNGVWQKFRFDFPLVVDGGGNYPGDAAFTLTSIDAIEARFLKIAIVPRNDYNQS